MDPRTLLQQFNLKPKKSLGQNFLVDKNAAGRIVAAANPSPQDVILEIGPGLGALTCQLAQAASQVIAVELDQRLLPVLTHTLAGCDNITLIHGDILQLDPATFAPPPNKIVANLPYYITSAVLRHLLESSLKLDLMTLTIQEEVARRIIAGPGEMSLLAVSVQLYGRPQIAARLAPGAFYPRPQVRSAVVRIDLTQRPRLDIDSVDDFFAVVRAGFGQRRKQLHNALTAGLNKPPDQVQQALNCAGIDPRRRAESLSLTEWAALTRALR